MLLRYFLGLACCLSSLTGTSLASSLSIGPNGINSAILQEPGIGVTGANIGIGQVEMDRPGMDPTDAANMIHDDVNPTAVFRRDGAPNTADTNDHPLWVAGIMISMNSGSLAGVAPDAKLYSSASVTGGAGGEQIVNTIEHVASRNNGDVRAINHSYGLELEGLGIIDGNSYLTRGVDWSASVHETLHIVAGNEAGGGFPLPTDNYNGITVGYSERVNGIYQKVHSGNVFFENPTQDRTAIGLIAPGEGVALTNLGTTSTAVPHPTGTSIAAPHVTGTVALLQELGDRNITNIGGAQWDQDNPKRHEVMKAVLLNSADKLSGVLGSTRTVKSNDATGNYTWETSLAAV